MVIFRNFPKPEETAGISHLSIGFFDGLHRGHLQVIRAFGPLESLDTSCLMSFWPHPQTLLHPDSAPALLMGLDHKLAALHQIGFAQSSIIPFDQHLASQSPEEFLGRLRLSFPNLQRLSVGPNFRFGHRRLGTPELLSVWCQVNGIEFRCADLVMHEGTAISSSRIRELVGRGLLEQASELLGYPYEFFGLVVRGDGRGNSIGFPTANLDVGQIILPPAGVYAGVVRIGDSPYPSAINIGSRPTVESPQAGDRFRIEVHVIGFEGNLYGTHLAASPLIKLRDQIKFASLAELTAQINDDLDQARSLINCEY